MGISFFRILFSRQCTRSVDWFSRCIVWIKNNKYEIYLCCILCGHVIMLVWVIFFHEICEKWFLCSVDIDDCFGCIRECIQLDLCIHFEKSVKLNN